MVGSKGNKKLTLFGSRAADIRPHMEQCAGGNDALKSPKAESRVSSGELSDARGSGAKRKSD